MLSAGAQQHGQGRDPAGGVPGGTKMTVLVAPALKMVQLRAQTDLSDVSTLGIIVA